MVFDLSSFQSPLPSNVQVFASGANRKAEIEGVALLGIPVGVSVNHLNESAIVTLLELRQPVMVDSGAFSEVAFENGQSRITSLIDDVEWRRRLAIYLRLASGLRARATLVAPDQVGNQQETLRRLERYSGELVAIAQTGATLLLPLQVGALTHAEFYQAALRAGSVRLTPAMPMRKAVTTSAALLSFMQEVRPRQIHLLGMGIDNRNALRLTRAIRRYCPKG